MLAVSRESEYEAPQHTEPVLGQQEGFSSRPPSRGLSEYPRENPLFDEEDEDNVQEASGYLHSVAPRVRNVPYVHAMCCDVLHGQWNTHNPNLCDG